MFDGAALRISCVKAYLHSSLLQRPKTVKVENRCLCWLQRSKPYRQILLLCMQSLLKLSKSPKEQNMEKVSIMKANASYEKLSKLPKEQNMEKVSSESKRFSLEQHMKSG